MQRKLNDDDDDTLKFFNGSSFIPAKDVISPEDDPELVNCGDNDESVLWHSTALNDNSHMVSYLQSSTSIGAELLSNGFPIK